MLHWSAWLPMGTGLLALGYGLYAWGYNQGYATGYDQGTGYAMCESLKAFRLATGRPWRYADANCEALKTQDWFRLFHEAQAE